MPGITFSNISKQNKIKQKHNWEGINATLAAFLLIFLCCPWKDTPKTLFLWYLFFFFKDKGEDIHAMVRVLRICLLKVVSI